jgi:predicted peptidase
MFWFAHVPLVLSLTLAPLPDHDVTIEPEEKIAKGFLYKTITLDGEEFKYCVWVPPMYDPQHAIPAILFLHGSGERGTDGFLQTDVGIGHAIRRHPSWAQAIVIMPQCRPNQSWVGPMGVVALKCLEKTSHEYHLNQRRIYLTGLSLGGHGAWHIAANLPGRFAAVAPVCGFAELGPSTDVVQKIAERLEHTPIWCFHGALDKNVPVTKSRELVKAIRDAGGEIEYTEYPDGSHAIWDKAYNNPEFWRWLLKQELPEAPSTPSP